MKNIILTLSVVTILGFGFSGCSDYLDSDYLFDERMTIENVFSNKDYSNRWLARGYYFLGHDDLQEICSKKHMPFNFADDMFLAMEVMKIGKMAIMMNPDTMVIAKGYGKMPTKGYVKFPFSYTTST